MLYLVSGLLRCVVWLSKLNWHHSNSFKLGLSVWPRLVHGFNSCLHGKQGRTRAELRGNLWFSPEVDPNEPLASPFIYSTKEPNSKFPSRLMLMVQIVCQIWPSWNDITEYWNIHHYLETKQKYEDSSCIFSMACTFRINIELALVLQLFGVLSI